MFGGGIDIWEGINIRLLKIWEGTNCQSKDFTRLPKMRGTCISCRYDQTLKIRYCSQMYVLLSIKTVI